MVGRLRAHEILPEFREESRGAQLDQRVLLLGLANGLSLGVEPHVVHDDGVLLPRLAIHRRPLRGALAKLVEGLVHLLVGDFHFLPVHVQAHVVLGVNRRPDIDLCFIGQRLAARELDLLDGRERDGDQLLIADR